MAINIKKSDKKDQKSSLQNLAQTLQPIKVWGLPPGAPNILSQPRYAPDPIQVKTLKKQQENELSPEEMNRVLKVKQNENNLPMALNYYADYGGCGYWRLGWSEYLINCYQKAIISGTVRLHLHSSAYYGIKCVRMQRQATDIQRQYVELLTKFRDNLPKLDRFKLIYEIDDVLIKKDIPIYNRARDPYDNEQILNNIKNIILQCDEMSVSTPYLKSYYEREVGHKKISVLPNYLPRFWADGYYNRQEILERFERNKKRPIVLYNGSGTHFDIANVTGNFKDDFYHVVEAIIKARKDFLFVFKGAYPLRLKPFIDNGEMKFYPWSPLPDYIRDTAAINANVVYAPLQNNEFNKSKSDIKITEAAALGLPGVFQDLEPYKEKADYVFTTGDELIDQLKYITKNVDNYMSSSDRARALAETLWLEDHLDEVMALYFTEFASEERKKMSLKLYERDIQSKS